ncbi:MAG: 3,4-dihydroxy-2-butanone-4-phosphate synthase [Paracoccus sp. (in: a-proteobacteria)]|uniref:3,4-dihydroxy-2-butanone-4-phosphate synthase n=1 Tax=Paracoccus sp. TaxID=267 RepID=UPI0026E065C5|nr:3,4-dihydroxy-2-butanone-4-phosphate synthase [Paracoccus sp. (in: a-proteobacteria)]MDO5630223.1 3,4-dihydroxy-2-butanone-4-phosphate synthase [Paracoccus sp. (in: a-proteobacteria)]
MWEFCSHADERGKHRGGWNVLGRRSERKPARGFTNRAFDLAGPCIIPAEFASPEIITFMARECRGLICLALHHSIAEQLGLSVVPRTGQSHRETAFTQSIEAAEGITTGISAADRAITIAAAIGPNGRDRIASPGHVFPLIARRGGLLERDGHTEASVDVVTLAGCRAAAVICEIMNDDGTMSRRDDLIIFARRHGLRIGTVESLVDYVSSFVQSTAHG